MPGGEESDRGAVGGSGGEASGGASLSRSSHSGTDRGSVGTSVILTPMYYITILM